MEASKALVNKITDFNYFSSTNVFSSIKFNKTYCKHITLTKSIKTLKINF